MTLDARLRRFLRQDESGTLMAEAVLVLPFMLWSYLALFVYWDSYRAVNTVQKAAYTISDMISREMLPVNQTYVNGMRTMMEYLIDHGQFTDVPAAIAGALLMVLARRFDQRDGLGERAPLAFAYARHQHPVGRSNSFFKFGSKHQIVDNN